MSLELAPASTHTVQYKLKLSYVGMHEVPRIAISWPHVLVHGAGYGSGSDANLSAVDRPHSQGHLVARGECYTLRDTIRYIYRYVLLLHGGI